MKNIKGTLPKIQTRLYIDGKWMEGSLKPNVVLNPATGEELIAVEQGGAKETEQAIAAAKKSFPLWSGMELKERVKILHRIGDLIEENINRLALIMTLEQGKPLAESKVEIQTNIDNMHWNAEEARRVYGETIPAPNNYKYEVKKQPVGVVGAITPWNFPSNMIVRKIAPAIAAGCTVVLKPASSTPLSAIAIFELFKEAGLPDGVANLVMGPASKIGKTLTASEDVRKLTFTGSTAVGQELYKQSGDTLKKISLELGGHAPFIVFADAPIEETVESLVKMKFRNNGQACTSPNRIFVEKSIKESFTKALQEAVYQVTVGNGLDGVTVGPLINEEARKTIDEQIADAKEKGADVLLGGERLTKGDYQKGFFYQPTILDGVTNKMNIFYEETFGPVIPLITFKSEEQVIKMANDSHFGLASYLFTKDLRLAEKVSRALQYGMVGINNTGISQPEAPFGGVKYSGLGRENGHFGIEEFMEIKFVNTFYF
ncbi:Succinate-semialdehyde dehydrogenase [NADP(+)] GabD [Jeotgalibaca dankookensis]|uniref:Succinate-semialdehyde dehydrogenase [NADP(+)] GabD n=1 Tax=Jeotgalibaca dankookensis TaxID=708126 RepID=A0A1S6INW4_9LACT|nr:Succinate-semialdehyde dehydrogenase [NADP(+)] GabD [Jeotgalibaca dankookensis]